MIRRLASDTRGATVLEFAMVIPVFLTLAMGLLEIGYQAYLQSVLTGAVQKAGRDSTIQGAAPATIDARVLKQVREAAPRAAFVAGSPARLSYADFGSINPEPFVDGNANGIRDAGECFTDTNGDGQWSADAGRTGQGGAKDVAVYKVEITYPRLFPVARWFGWSANQTLSANTALMNQPYASQVSTTASTICT